MNHFIVTLSSRDSLNKILDFAKANKIDIVAKEVTNLSNIDWVTPGRPANDNEIEAMISEIRSEEAAGIYLTSDEARKASKELFRDEL
ncbi:MAG: hypothetical protein WCO63_03330 [Bacteroidota bacterium]